jgi:hypothetical protein
VRKRIFVGTAGVAAFAVIIAGSALAAIDFGLFRDSQLANKSQSLFGVGKPVESSSQASIDQSTAEANPLALVTLAGGLHASVVTSAADTGTDTDMMALWPDDVDPEWLIACNEGGAGDPGVQRIEIATGEVETILTGTEACDPLHRTPWGTIVFAEEEDDGHLYELIDPLNTTDVQLDRSSGTTSGGTGAENVVRRDAMGFLAWEGIGILETGVVYFGDELRPYLGAPGGGYYKFVPDEPWDGVTPVDDLSESPLASGERFGLRLGLLDDDDDGLPDDFGHGTSSGLGEWVGPLSPDLRADAENLSLTGYYRPEDLALDRAELAAVRVHFCSNNTGNEAPDRYYGETICISDGTTEEAFENSAVPEVQSFVIGHPELAMMDNVAYQPGRGNWIIHEDGAQLQGNNDLWDCLSDGADDDLLSDGCVRVGTLNDLEAEWTGGVFDASGTRLFVSLQHNVTGHGVVLEISGWK